MKKVIILFLLFFITTGVFGQIRLPRLVSDNMLLQRDTPARIWGWAAANEAVKLVFKKQTYNTVADSAGNWEILLPAQKAGGPYNIVVNNLEIKNVLFGDVWLCSGQSNMETPISRVMTLFGDEIMQYANPNIRYVKIPMMYNFHAPQTDVSPCSWVELTPETAADFSAVAYFFAKEVFEKTNIPVGLINSSVGGSPAEAWISEEALQRFPSLLNDKRICESDEFVSGMLRLGALAGQRWYDVLNSCDEGLNGTVKWSASGYDDRSWQTTDLPDDSSWGKQNFRPVNGVFWFRKTVEIPAGWENQPAKLYMGRIVNSDSVYVNGTFVGTTSYQYPPRNYTIPGNVLRAGKNEIAVRLVCPVGFPEFVRDKPYRIVLNHQEISLEGEWKYKTGAVMPPMPGGGVTFQYKPVGLYNAMIAPLKNHAVKGFLWYQGEANTGKYDEYYDLMSALIYDWRGSWGETLPFFIVQLPNFMEPALLQPNSNWAALRDVQRRLSQTIPNTALTVTIDLGEWNDIHPLNKKDVGKRLALQARRLVYGEKIVGDGPVYQSCETKENKMILSFKEGTDDWMPVDELKGFAVAGADGVYHPAQAVIDGRQIVVWNDTVVRPVAVRYAWANNPEGANLKNRSRLPASPFQTY